MRGAIIQIEALPNEGGWKWKLPGEKKVPSSFGIADVIFAGHPSEEKQAKEAIKEAKNAGATFEDFEKEMVWHCYRKFTAPEMLQEHLKKQVARAKKLWGK
jgi:hypothetical protein